MQFIQPSDRNQIEMLGLESSIGAGNTVRLIDAFADQLDLKHLGFILSDLNEQGRPAFESRIFIKLYFNGYMNGLRNDQTKMGLPAAGRATITPTSWPGKSKWRNGTHHGGSQLQACSINTHVQRFPEAFKKMEPA